LIEIVNRYNTLVGEREQRSAVLPALPAAQFSMGVPAMNNWLSRLALHPIPAMPRLTGKIAALTGCRLHTSETAGETAARLSSCIRQGRSFDHTSPAGWTLLYHKGNYTTQRAEQHGHIGDIDHHIL
jgi:hypothetical protein